VTSADRPGAGDQCEDRWPVALRGVTESIVTTLGPNELWNAAALGLQVTNGSNGDGDAKVTDRGTTQSLVTARTWGRTRTRRNFADRGAGYVQFVSDPVAFTRAALSIHEESDPVLDGAAAWVRVCVERIDGGIAGETRWIDWALTPETARTRRQVVPTINRGHGAVIEATVAASRLDVPSYDRATLCERLAHLEGVVERCGGPREVEAMALIGAETDESW
jgi:uncharacterized protein